MSMESLAWIGRRESALIVRIVACAAALLTARAQAAPPESPKPNLIIILTDDQGYADVACNGGKNVTTPHLDKLASEGMRFTSFYVTQGQCSPSRGSHSQRSECCG